MKKKSLFKSAYQKLKEREKQTGKKFDKILLKFAKAVDNFKQAQIDTNTSIWDVYMEGRR